MTAGDGPPPGMPVPGPGVDRYGQPVIDPTRNVLDLVSAAIQRQDDLRAAEQSHVRELLDIRFGYEEKLRDKESARIDAIRAVDVGAVSRAAEVSATQATTLATAQQASADALRAQVEGARIATADALAQALAPIIKSVEDLRAAQYQQQGEKSSRTETSTSDRDALAIEQARIAAANSRMQLYGLIIAAVVLALGFYATFHK
jgi:hypothetical protein